MTDDEKIKEIDNVVDRLITTSIDKKLIIDILNEYKAVLERLKDEERHEV